MYRETTDKLQKGMLDKFRIGVTIRMGIIEVHGPVMGREMIEDFRMVMDYTPSYINLDYLFGRLLIS